MRKEFWVALVLIVLASSAAVAQGTSVFHDPWLNWDFWNQTGQLVNDFHIIVEAQDWYTQQVWTGLWPDFRYVHGDNNGDGVPDTMLVWEGTTLGQVMPMHVGLHMLDSGRILDAYWTFDGVKVGSSVPITYERTRIFDPDPTIPDDKEIHMILQIAPGYYADLGNEGQPVGWTNIRTFANLPADMLGLADLNEGLDLNALQPFEVVPLRDGPGGEPIIGPVYYDDFPAESFFDVYFDIQLPDGEFGPHRESLLVANVIDGQGQVIGTFYNLNPQCPEPGTYALIAAGLGALVLRFRRKK
jgi:hypothetical protein